MRKRMWSIGVGGAVVLVAVLGWLQSRHPAAAARVYTIGWTDSPPFQVRRPDGQPTGLAVDLVRLAAERRGIRLRWVYWQSSSESALRGKKVDLWPLITITPERLQRFHISEPYLEADYSFLVLADSPYTKMQDLRTATIGFANAPIDQWHLVRHLPEAHALPRTLRTQVLEDLCARRADAAFLDAFTSISMLLEEHRACEQPLRWIAAPEIRSHFGIGAPFETRDIADSLRDEIGAVAAEGKLASIVSQWGYTSAQLESIESRLGARKREQRLALAAGLFALLFAVACWLCVRFLRERNRTRQTEATLRQTEQKLRLMANNMKEMVLAYDMNRRLIFANPAVETLTGYRIADLERGAFVNWIHPDDQARMLTNWDKLFAGDGYVEEEYRLVTRDGRTRWASATWGPIRDEAGRQIGVQGSERDITERKLAAEALRESEQRFRGLLEHVQLAAAICDADGRIVFVNDYLLDITGWTRQELIGQPAGKFVPPERREAIRELIEKLARTGEPAHWYQESPVLTRSGKVRWLQVSSVVLRDVAGKVAAVASLGPDVTEHRALQEQYLQSQKLESLGTLAGGVAHDFNNLLTVINGYSDIAFQSLSDRDAVRSKIDQIRKAGARAAELTQQLLAFSRRQITQPRPLDLNRVIEESAGMFRTLLGEDIELVTTLSPSLRPVMADQGQLHQVLMNLMANARDAMPAGGRLTIETANGDTSPAEAAEHPDVVPGPFVLLAVTDTGSGIDEQTRLHIFEPFFTTKGTGKGTGLGLSTVYGIVKQNGGWIRVQSEVGKGTAFQVYLPRLAAELTPAAETHSAATGPGNRETVLVVEDQDEVRGLATAILESRGYRVLSAADGPSALALVDRHSGPIDLALTDVILPGMNGKQLVERLKLLRPEIRVLFTSGYSQDVIAHRGVLDPGVAYIAKPYSPEILAAKVRQVLHV
jgi:two-component system, cell cycle sensor histidine kinase and response regulator CckA